MFQFASGVSSNKGYSWKRFNQKKADSVSRMAEKRIAFKDIMQDLSREYRSCDPK
jgi:hypothetical protein